ncbi:sensor histidine kinase [Streptomyces sp. 6N223]|uniref:sensor histidine kinase n=1 Tax=Streptomyces sp. 6N223 TaxID=3457412 RepID=UPI003FD26702
MNSEHGAPARQWLRAHPLALDALIAVASYAVYLCAAVTIAQSPMEGSGFAKRDLPAHSLVLGALACAALVLRRKAPMTVLVSVLTLSMAELLLGTSSHQPVERHSSILMTVAVALFTVASRSDRPTTVRVWAFTVAVATPGTMLLGQQPWYAQENLGAFAWMTLAAVTGEAVRSRRAVINAIRERAERAERTREEEARRRVTEERMRIARELHDVVAHHIALVNVQAGVASHVMDTRPDQAKEALAHIRQESRRALAELQTTVGLLRHQDEPIAPTEPARGLAVLDDLIDGFVRTGMSVTLDERVDDAGPLPSAVDLAAYRVVQEALTNVHKHAGADATALVRIVRSGGTADEALDIIVLDDGGARREREKEQVKEQEKAQEKAQQEEGGGAVNGSGSGHGLTGMRERATALSGSCEAGPLEGGGFRVRVRLPLKPPRPPGAEEAAAVHAGREQAGRCS